MNICYRSKGDEIIFPKFDEAPSYLFISTFALWWRNEEGEYESVKIPTRDRFSCGTPIDYIQLNFIFPISQAVVDAYDPADPSLQTIDGELVALTDFDEEAQTHPETSYDTLSALVSYYINYYDANPDSVPHSSVYFKTSIEDLSSSIKKLEI